MRLSITLLLYLTLSMAFELASARDNYHLQLPLKVKTSQLNDPVFKSALQKTLIKASGELISEKELPSTPSIFIDEYYYSNQNNEQTLNVSFDKKAIDKYLKEINKPAWQNEKSTILVWLNLNPTKGSSVIDNARTQSFINDLQQQALARGVNFIFPNGDLSDISQISAHDYTPLQLEKFLTASERYHLKTLLILNAQQNSDSWQSDAYFIDNNQTVDWQLSADTYPKLIAENLNKLVANLKAKALQEEPQPAQTLFILVRGVQGSDDYQRLQSLLESTALVSQVELDEVTANTVLYKLTTLMSEQKLKMTLSQEKIIRFVNYDSYNKTLFYQLTL